MEPNVSICRTASACRPLEVVLHHFLHTSLPTVCIVLRHGPKNRCQAILIESSFEAAASPVSRIVISILCGAQTLKTNIWWVFTLQPLRSWTPKRKLLVRLGLAFLSLVTSFGVNMAQCIVSLTSALTVVGFIPVLDTIMYSRLLGAFVLCAGVPRHPQWLSPVFAILRNVSFSSSLCLCYFHSVKVMPAVKTVQSYRHRSLPYRL